jgi:plastocyanin
MKRLVFVFALLSFPVFAANVTITVLDGEGAPVLDAVVLVYAKDPSSVKMAPPQKAVMKQIDKQFKPHVLPVSTGTSVEFPNADNVKHHVYSFSDAKTFELELYDEFQGMPIAFDKPGIVELGCNIHDWMLAYVYVTDAHYFYTTPESGVVMQSLPDGDYTLKLWHPRAQVNDNQKEYSVSISGDQMLTYSFTEEFDEILDFSDGFDDY